MAGSYEALFSRRAMKYKELGLKDQKLSREDYRRFIISEYTFLKRPVILLGPKILSDLKKTIEALKKLQLIRPAKISNWATIRRIIVSG